MAVYIGMLRHLNVFERWKNNSSEIDDPRITRFTLLSGVYNINNMIMRFHHWAKANKVATQESLLIGWREGLEWCRGGGGQILWDEHFGKMPENNNPLEMENTKLQPNLDCKIVDNLFKNNIKLPLKGNL